MNLFCNVECIAEVCFVAASSVSNDPVLHFVLFVPSATQRPLYILGADGNHIT
jgi:hypothetical protein